MSTETESPCERPCRDCSRLAERIEANTARIEELESRIAGTVTPTLDRHGGRLDRLESSLQQVSRELRTLSVDVGRIADAQTTQSMMMDRTFSVVEKVARNVTRLVEISEQRTVIVEHAHPHPGAPDAAR